MTGQELKQWREARGLNQSEVGDKLGVSHSAVNRWENGQDIPGPAQLLLEMLIHGKMPFSGVGPVGDPEQEAKNFWQLKLTLDDWHRLESLATAAGYDDTKDYILSLIQEDLREHAAKTPAKMMTYPATKEFLGSGGDLPLAAETPSADASCQDEAQKSLRDAAAAFETVTPPPTTSSIRYSGPGLRAKSKRRP